MDNGRMEREQHFDENERRDALMDSRPSREAIRELLWQGQSDQDGAYNDGIRAVLALYDAALPSEPPSEEHPLDDTLRVIGALAHEASRDHEKDGCVVCVAARPVLAALSEPTEPAAKGSEP